MRNNQVLAYTLIGSTERYELEYIGINYFNFN